MKVLDEVVGEHRLVLTLAAQASSHQTMTLRENHAGLHLHSENAQLAHSTNAVRTANIVFPQGRGYVTKVVQFTW